ncbi:MarR family winged helix-turn-helix transcriptional regulator [Sphingopyxis sp.]|uniref:MarR family winged helix-turn-helix transcriptional regulator n=1 Tax=Sphingopyxis sp. TaxID=1908224 RepID=UPI003D0E981D
MRGAERLAAVDKSVAPMAAALPDLPMDETIMVRLLRICVVGLGQYFEPVFRQMGLSESSFHALCLLMAEQGGEASPAKLSELIGASRAHMSQIVDALSRDALVERISDPNDARRHSVRITTGGRAHVQSGLHDFVGPMEQAFAGLNPDEFAQLAALLRKAILSFDRDAFEPRPSA